MRALRHQPFLIWTIVLVLLLAVGFVGTQSGERTTTPPAVPVAVARADARSLLEDLPSLTEAIGTGRLTEWRERTEATVSAGVEQSQDSPLANAWENVAAALEVIAELEENGEREEILLAAGTYSSSVMTLVRATR